MKHVRTPKEDRAAYGTLKFGVWYDLMGTPNHILTLVGMQQGCQVVVHTSNISEKPDGFVGAKQHGKPYTKDVEIRLAGARWVRVDLELFEVIEPLITVHYLGRN